MRPPQAPLWHQQHRFEKPAVRRHRQELQYPLLSSLPFPSLPITSRPFPALPSRLRPSRPRPALLRAKKRKTNSFPYKWSESLQPRDPLELQIFHLCPGAPCYYCSAIIPPLSFSPLLPLPFLYLLSCASHLRRPPPPPVQIHLPIGEELAQLPSVASQNPSVPSCASTEQRATRTHFFVKGQRYGRFG